MIFLISIFSQEAIAKLDQQVCESKKRLNAMRHQFKMKEKKLSAFQTEFDQMTKDSETISLADTGDSDESRVSNLNYLKKSKQRPSNVIIWMLWTLNGRLFDVLCWLGLSSLLIY